MIARFFLFLMFLFLTGPVQAQTFEKCLPKTLVTPLASGTSMVSAEATAAQQVPPAAAVTAHVRGFYCPQSDGTWSSYIHYCIVGRTCLDPSQIDVQLNNLAGASNLIETVFNSLAAGEQQPKDEEWPAILAATSDVQSKMVAIRPKDKIYVVKANTRCTTATGCTRPVYELKDGVLSTKEIGRSPVGSLCSLARPKLASGSDFWAEFAPNFVAGAVTLCTLKSQ